MKFTQPNRPLAVITGATGGIGRQICCTLAENGYRILAHFQNAESIADELRQEIESLGSQCVTVSADLATHDGLEELITSVKAATEPGGAPRVQVLVNNAALLLGPGFEDATIHDFDRYVAVNVRAPFFLAQRIAGWMPAGGAIINISSVGAHFSSPGDIVYAMSKAALESMTFHAAEKLAKRRIRINNVIPGFTNNGHPLFDDPEVNAYVSSFAVLGGVGTPNDVAEAVEFLASPRANRITGTSIDISGGSALGANQPRAKLSLSRLK